MRTLLTNLWRAIAAALTVSAAPSGQAQAWKPGDPIPAASHVFGGALSREADEFLTKSNLAFNDKQAALQAKWLEGQKRFDIDMQKGLLRVERTNSTTRFDVQLAGSHSKRSNTWEWAWNNPNVPPTLTAAAIKARDLGERFKLRYATMGMVPVPEAQFPWFLSALVSEASNAVGVFRAPAGDYDYYFVLFNPRE